MKKTIPVLLFFLLSLNIITAQNNPIPQLNTEQLFTQARDTAFAGNRKQARIWCEQALAKSPNYHDIRIFMGRTYAWDKQHQTAKANFKQVLQKQPNHKDALSALWDVEMWSGQTDTALQVANTALKYHENNEGFLLKKAKSLNKLNRHKEALETVKQTKQLYPDNEAAKKLKKQIQLKTFKWAAGTTYQIGYNTFDKKWVHSANISLKRKTPIGSLIAKANFNHRLGISALQWEFDFYPKIAKGIYGYLNYGNSSMQWFPKHRGGAELFFKTPIFSEMSVGWRGLWFGEAPNQSNINIYTVSATQYHKNIMVNARVYITPKEKGTSKSGSLAVTRYFKDSINWVKLQAGMGFSPDTRYLQNLPVLVGVDQMYYLKARTIGISCQKKINYRSQLTANFTARNQENTFEHNTYYWMYSANAGVKVLF